MLESVKIVFCLPRSLRPKWNIYVVLVPYLPYFVNPTQNINLLLEVKYLKIGTFSDFDTIFFIKCFLQKKIISLSTCPNFFGMKQEPHIYFILASVK